MQNYMLDTNIFGKLKREGLDQNSLQGVRIFVTHNQIDEIKQIQGVEKRNQLMEILQQAGSHEAQTRSFFLDVSIPGKAKLSGKNSRSSRMIKTWPK